MDHLNALRQVSLDLDLSGTEGSAAQGPEEIGRRVLAQADRSTGGCDPKGLQPPSGTEGSAAQGPEELGRRVLAQADRSKQSPEARASRTLTVTGFSISGLATYLQIPSLDVCFDLGECPLSALPINHVFLTHAHGDHARCLPRHWQLRRMLGNPRAATYFLPEAIRAGCEGWIRAEAQFEGVPEDGVETPAFHGLVASEALVALPHRPDLRVRAFDVRHSVPSLGYTILAHKRKLRAEYAGVPGAEIAALRKRGVDVQHDVDDPLVTFIGDCVGASLIEQAHIWASPVVIIEATFLEAGEEALAARKMHTHLADIAAALEQLGDRVATRHIVLKHFSMRYAREQVLALVDRGIPEAFRERIRVLL